MFPAAAQAAAGACPPYLQPNPSRFAALTVGSANIAPAVREAPRFAIDPADPFHCKLFEAWWAEARRDRHLKDICRPTRRGPIDLDNRFVQQALTRRELVHRRLAVGFECVGITIAGRERAPFREEGLRSTHQHVLRRFVQLTPRAKRLLVGRDKESVWHPDSKLLGLDEPYVTLNSVMRGAWRVDLDRDFASWEYLKWELEQLPLPCLPHAVVAYECPKTGRIERPHLWYVLPYGSEVWWSPNDPRCRKPIMRLWRGVLAGVCKVLMALGADPGGLANPLKGKNPLSPYWATQVWNDKNFPDLTTWASWVDTRTTFSTLARESAATTSDLGKQQSNQIFTSCQRWCYEELRNMHWSGCKDYWSCLDDRDQLARLLFKKLTSRAVAGFERPQQACAVLKRVVAYAVDRWDPESLKATGRDRGACADQVAGKSLSERQRIGGQYAASLRSAASLQAITHQIAILKADGETVTQSEVARRSGLSRSTVSRHWKTAIAHVDELPPAVRNDQATITCVNRCIGKKVPQGRQDQTTADGSEGARASRRISAPVDMMSGSLEPVDLSIHLVVHPRIEKSTDEDSDRGPRFVSQATRHTVGEEVLRLHEEGRAVRQITNAMEGPQSLFPKAMVDVRSCSDKTGVSARALFDGSTEPVHSSAHCIGALGPEPRGQGNKRMSRPVSSNSLVESMRRTGWRPRTASEWAFEELSGRDRDWYVAHSLLKARSAGPSRKNRERHVSSSLVA